MAEERPLREGHAPRPNRPTAPVEKRGGYTPQGQAPRPVSPPPKPADASASAKPPAKK